MTGQSQQIQTPPKLNSLEPIPVLRPPSDWKAPGYIRIDRDHLYALARRCSGQMLAMALLIEDRSRSFPGSPEWAEISNQEWRALTGSSDRANELNLKRLESSGIMARQSDKRGHRGGYRLRYENFESSPLPAPRTHECKPRGSTAELREQMPVAALYSERAKLISVETADGRANLISLDANSDAVKQAMNCAQPGGCPLLSLAGNSGISQSVSSEREPPRPTDTSPPHEPEPDDGLDALIERVAQKIRPKNADIPAEQPGPKLRPMIRIALARTPLHRLEYLAQQRMKPGDSLGLLIKLAEEANQVFNQQQRQIELAEQSTEQKKIEGWKELIDSNAETPEAKKIARECLRNRGIEYPFLE
jgi:hypothetical protein